VRKALEAVTGNAELDIADLKHVVIGTPGAINPATGQLGYARHLPGWHSPGVLTEIREELGVGVDVENDVNLTAIAELWEGRALTSENFVLLWVSEGLGLAIVLGGEIHRGATGGAGEVGYLPVPGAPLSRNASRGADVGFQTTAGASAVLRLARSHGVRGRSATDVVRRASTTDKDSQFLRELATRLATGLAAVVSVLDPELIVLAGDVALAGGEVLRELTESELYSLVLPRPTLVLSEVEGNSVRAGAIHTALAVARDTVFGSTVPSSPVST
jgi:predicted NBD/HSP70 family sugar kinase